MEFPSFQVGEDNNADNTQEAMDSFPQNVQTEQKMNGDIAEKRKRLR